LIALVCDQLADPPDDPFAPELIAVPTRGIERWITQRTATELAARGVGDGISANIGFPSPSRLVRDTLLAVPALAASVAAWDGPALTGHVLAAIDSHVAEPWMRLIQRYIEADHSSNRLTAATKIARLFSTYARRRPHMIRSWSTENTGPGGEEIPEGDRWQPLLWRVVRETIGVPALAELLPEGLDPIRTGEITLDLPERIMVYGLTATDPFDLDVLAALGEQRDVRLYVLHPSPALWEQTAARLGTGTAARVARDQDPTAALARHPMLTSWARESRELQEVFAAHGFVATPMEPKTRPATTVLARLQDDIRQNQPVTFDENLADGVTAGHDRSLQIHIGHGARRQAEIARDAVLHVLADDPTLEPRDVVIMTPDLATFAPLLEAAFPGEEARSNQGLPDLRLRIADRSPAAINPLVRSAAAVLGLADGRLEASVVRELVARPVVQQRFGFDADTAGAIVDLVNDANISWGIDADDREAWGAGRNEQRTWHRGLDRALAGVFFSDSPVRVVAGTAPLDGIEGQEAIPAGLLAALLDRLTAIRTMVATPMPMSAWGPAIATSVRMLAAPAWGDEWQLGQLERLLTETFPEATPDAPDPLISLPEARRAIAGWADTRPSPLHFRTGDVTVCTLVPMRSVPYRVVCLLGMDDDRFPRSSRTDGDDLLLGDETVGDFDRSAQDRQLLLDAVMAAGDHLIITYSGRDELTNAELSPAVPIAELRDTLEELVGSEAITRLVTTHPLQSFSEANFRPGALFPAGPFGFDPVQLAGARAVQTRILTPEPPVLAWPEIEPPVAVKLTDLIAFLQYPTGYFLRTRAGFSVPQPGDVPDDTLPADLDPLSRWAVKNRLVEGLAAGYDLAGLAARESATDGLAPGALGTDDLAAAGADASLLWEAALELGYDRSKMLPWSGVVKAGDTTVEGAVLADPDHGHLLTVTPSVLKGKQRLKAFVELVFLNLLEPDIGWKAILLGRGSQNKHLAVTIGPLGRTPAERHQQAEMILTDLVDLYREGHRVPLPLPCESGYRWQRGLATDRNKAWRELSEAWETDRYNAESLDSAHLLLLADLRDTAALLESRFEEYCERLWLPILSRCREKLL
jgi:exodeoxyribonuclease V gamma subunit